jgi:hypothetical protein
MLELLTMRHTKPTGSTSSIALRGPTLIAPRRFDEAETHDAVHYTNAGNELIFRELEPFL